MHGGAIFWPAKGVNNSDRLAETYTEPYTVGPLEGWNSQENQVVTINRKALKRRRALPHAGIATGTALGEHEERELVEQGLEAPGQCARRGVPRRVPEGPDGEKGVAIAQTQRRDAGARRRAAQPRRVLTLAQRQKTLAFDATRAVSQARRQGWAPFIWEMSVHLAARLRHSQVAPLQATNSAPPGSHWPLRRSHTTCSRCGRVLHGSSSWMRVASTSATESPVTARGTSKDHPPSTLCFS